MASDERRGKLARTYRYETRPGVERLETRFHTYGFRVLNEANAEKKLGSSELDTGSLKHSYGFLQWQKSRPASSYNLD